MKFFKAIFLVSTSLVVGTHSQVYGPLVMGGQVEPAGLVSSSSKSLRGPSTNEESPLVLVDASHRELKEKCKKRCWKKTSFRSAGCVKACVKEVGVCKTKCKAVAFRGKFKNNPPAGAKTEFCIKVCKPKKCKKSCWKANKKLDAGCVKVCTSKEGCKKKCKAIPYKKTPPKNAKKKRCVEVCLEKESPCPCLNDPVTKAGWETVLESADFCFTIDGEVTLGTNNPIFTFSVVTDTGIDPESEGDTCYFFDEGAEDFSPVLITSEELSACNKILSDAATSKGLECNIVF